MSKPDAFLLDPEHYPMRSEIGVRYSDLDVNQHLNNVSLVDILQEARGHFHRATGMRKATSDFTLVVANLNVQFLGEGFHGEPIICHTGLRALGRTSQTIGQLALQGEKPIAYAETVMVTMLDGKPGPHPSAYRTEMEPWLISK